MTTRYRTAIVGVFFATTALLTVGGCSSEDPTTPENVTTPTFENIWPAEVGHHWTFELNNHPFTAQEELFPTSDEVPGVPSMEELYADLQNPTRASAEGEERGIFHLRFSEDISQEEGTTTLRLDNQTEDLVGEPYPPSPLWRGLVWERSGTRISYLMPGFLGWLHLDVDLSLGHEFSGPVADNLDGRIWRNLEFTILGTKYSNCIECFYVVDMGVKVARNEQNEIEGYYRSFGYVRIVYAPELGPVFCHEHIMMDRSLWDNRVALLESFGSK